MSQQQPKRREQEQPQRHQPNAPAKYGDVLPVSGELASKAVARRDAATMQSAENAALGRTQKGGPAAVMQSAAAINERADVSGHFQASDVAAEQGVTLTQTQVPGACIVTECVGGQVVGQTIQPTSVARGGPGTVAGGGIGGAAATGKVTIGEALEAVALTAGDKPIEQSDAAAIQAAEIRATGSTGLVPGGVASAAQSAASMNAQAVYNADKIKLADVLMNATMKMKFDKERMKFDKEATRQDAEGVVSAELRNNPYVATHPGGVAASIAAAARFNEGQGQQ